jgi:hypothetical protein
MQSELAGHAVDQQQQEEKNCEKAERKHKQWTVDVPT